MLGVVLEGYDMKVLTEIDSWNKAKEKVFNRLPNYKNLATVSGSEIFNLIVF